MIQEYHPLHPESSEYITLYSYTEAITSSYNHGLFLPFSHFDLQLERVWWNNLSLDEQS